VQPQLAAPVPAPNTPQGAAAAAVQQQQQQFQQLRQQRRERVDEGGRRIIEEPGRIIVREHNTVIIQHDETERFRRIGRDVREERRGGERFLFVPRPGGVQVVSVVDDSGHLLRRFRRGPDGREVVLIDNGPPDRFRRREYFVELAPPRIVIPAAKYVVNMERASAPDLIEALVSPPLEPLERAYTLDEIRYSYGLRARMRSIDLDTITFEFNSWEVTPDQVGRLEAAAAAIRDVIARNPNEVFLIEGHTDAVGSDEDNLSLSDRRAEAVAVVLTENFQIPAENLTTQGYGKQFLKIQTPAAERQNRRVTVRRITPLLAGR
jgi:outer membrane protein OmpA-like peptidoglycan-associated protein